MPTRGCSSPTCVRPTISVQNLCDSSMSRTLSTRWLMRTGLTARGGVRSDMVEPPSFVLSVLLPQCGMRNWGRRAAVELPAEDRAERDVDVARLDLGAV